MFVLGLAIGTATTLAVRVQTRTRAFVHHYIDSDRERPFRASFLGVPAWQTPTDLWLMQELIYAYKPDLIIETGTARGGTALFYAAVLAQAHPTGRVITIDQAPKQSVEARRHLLFQQHVEAWTGDVLDPSILTRLKKRARGKRVIVALDSLHNDRHVLAELKEYSKLVKPGGYLVVQDTVIDQRSDWVQTYAPGGAAGPALAVQRFLRDNPSFRDTELEERYLLSFHPGGYLLRTE